MYLPFRSFIGGNIVGLSATAQNGIAWLLRDDFSDTRAAGAVNGTPATPGPGGNRNVTDGNSKLSIGGGVANFATGGVGTGNPGLWYSSQVRAPGLLCAGKINASSGGIMVGFDTSAVGQIANCVRSNGTSLEVLSGNNLVGAVGSVTLGADYVFFVISRASGAAFWAYGGSQYLQPTLLWVGAAGTESVLLPGFGDCSGATVGAVDFIACMAANWLPPPLASDGFGSTFGTTDGAGHAETSGIGSGGGGLAWTGSTWSVSGGKAINTPGSGSELITNGGFGADTNWTKGVGWTISGGTANQDGSNVSPSYLSQSVTFGVGNWYIGQMVATRVAGATRISIAGIDSKFKTTSGTIVLATRALTASSSVTITGDSGPSFVGSVDDVSVKQLVLSDLFASVLCSTADVLADVALTIVSGTQAGLVLNLDSTSSPANFVIAYHDGTNAKLEKCVAGTYTTVISAAATYSANAVLRVTKIGPAYRLYYNNALIGSGTISDTGIISNAQHGLFSTYSGNTLDNFVVYASGSEGQYSNLNQYIA